MVRALGLSRPASPGARPLASVSRRTPGQTWQELAGGGGGSLGEVVASGLFNIRADTLNTINPIYAFHTTFSPSVDLVLTGLSILLTELGTQECSMGLKPGTTQVVPPFNGGTPIVESEMEIRTPDAEGWVDAIIPPTPVSASQNYDIFMRFPAPRTLDVQFRWIDQLTLTNLSSHRSNIIIHEGPDFSVSSEFFRAHNTRYFGTVA